MSWDETRKKLKQIQSMAIETLGDYREYIRTELERRKKLSPHYSMRDMAKQMGLSPSQLSRVLKGERGLSIKSAAKIANAMGIEGALKLRFQTQVKAQGAKSLGTRHHALLSARKKWIANAYAEQKEFCEKKFTWSEQVKEFDRFGNGINLKLRKLLLHRAESCGLISN